MFIPQKFGQRLFGRGRARQDEKQCVRDYVLKSYGMALRDETEQGGFLRHGEFA